MATSFEIFKMINNEPCTAFVVDKIDDENDALFLARLYASEHYAAIHGDTGILRDCRYGARFVTNNGTPVEYLMRKEK